MTRGINKHKSSTFFLTPFMDKSFKFRMRIFIALTFLAAFGLAPTARAGTDEQNANSIVFKGLSLGMPIDDACQTINAKIGRKMLSVSQDEKSKLKKILSDKTTILSDQSGNVTSFQISKELLDVLFVSSEMSQDDFLQSFINAYNIPELKSKMVEITAIGQLAMMQRLSGESTSLGFQQVYTYQSPDGFELTFFGKPSIGGESDPVMLGILQRQGTTNLEEAGSMLLKTIPTAKAREANFD